MTLTLVRPLGFFIDSTAVHQTHYTLTLPCLLRATKSKGQYRRISAADAQASGPRIRVTLPDAHTYQLCRSFGAAAILISRFSSTPNPTQKGRLSMSDTKYDYRQERRAKRKATACITPNDTPRPVPVDRYRAPERAVKNESRRESATLNQPGQKRQGW